jgi:hypothetical protein
VGRPRKFNREGVLQKALPVFYGFARATLPGSYAEVGFPGESWKVIANGRTELKRLLRANIASEKSKMNGDALCELNSECSW